MSETNTGRPAKVTESDVVKLLERSSDPIISSGDIAERFDCTTQTARDVLSNLEDEEIVERKQVGSSYAWYLSTSDDTEEDVIPFLDSSYLFIGGATESTVKAVSEFAEERSSYNNNYIFHVKRRAISDFRREQELRDTIRSVIDYRPFEEHVVELWYRSVGVLFFNEDGSPIMKTVDKETHSSILSLLDEKHIVDRRDDRSTVLDQSSITQAVETVRHSHPITDNRDAQKYRRRLLSTVHNAELDELTYQNTFIGFDNEQQAHVYEPAGPAIYVITGEGIDVNKSRVVESTDAIPQWIKFIEQERCGWKELEWSGT